MRRARPAGLRIAMPRSPRVARQANVPPRLAEKAQVAFAKLSLAVLDIDTLRALWQRRGGSSREFIDGEIQVLNQAGEAVLRGTPDAVGTWLRRRLEAIA